MNNKLTYAYVFCVSAAASSAVAWYLTKKKYEKMAQVEIDSVKKVKRERKETVDSVAKPVPKKEEPVVLKYLNKIKDTGYAGDTVTDPRPTLSPDRPYVIKPEDFGEFYDYEKVSLTYYADHVLADSNDDRVDDVDATVGSEALGSFGDYEDDSVFVRNDRLKCDYEILLDEETYSEVLKTHPPGSRG